MWTASILVTAAIAYLLYSEIMETLKKDRPSLAENQPGAVTHRNFNQHNHQRGPIFSPDRRHIWDGEKWVRNDGGFSGGVMMGIVIAIIIYVILHF